ncbi:hypothetical protein L873DRAFT_1294368 [Choiromyces venosus 120613-1]|uniref:Secreted protein n=1 Tax=Choiromyces venosus 120613-1 TaxID=1336337 RepID=A0A3N4JFC6_9PEZI|nr:hypothetical protein L873DRAFT_1294368 [Choiromyces venosus 120613-1]
MPNYFLLALCSFFLWSLSLGVLPCPFVFLSCPPGSAFLSFRLCLRCPSSRRLQQKTPKCPTRLHQSRALALETT